MVMHERDKKLGGTIEIRGRICFSQAVQDGFLEEVSLELTGSNLGKLEERV